MAVCIWKAPFTSVQPLPSLAPGLGAWPYGITPDGRTIVGTARLGGSYHAVRWDTATLAITLLETVVANSAAFGISDDGSTIVGGVITAGADPPVSNITPAILWTGGGSAGSLLAPSGAGPVYLQWVDYGMPSRLISGGGSTVVGGDQSTEPTAFSSSVKWVSGINTYLPGLATNGTTDTGAASYSVSADGSVVVGVAGQHLPSSTNPVEAGYWSGTALRRLAVPSAALTGATGPGQVLGFYCNGDASVIWGETTDFAFGSKVSCYWDGVTTPSGDGIHYGVSHIMAQLPNTQTTYQKVFWVADDPGILIAVGSSPVGADNTHACKWTGVTAADLGAIDTAQQSEAWGCNHDGTVSAGWSYDSGLTKWPVRWDAGNALHILPSLADPGDSFQGQAYGVSRDGSTIYGVIDVSSTPPPPLPLLAIDDVNCTTIPELAVNEVYLDWSDDRGHSFGNPVGHPMGDAGQYLTSVQYQRLGYGRDRVFRVFWSVPTKTALQGAWIEATPADS